jgi:hypothetical protein
VGLVAYLQNVPLWLVGVCIFALYVVALAFGGRLAEAVRKRLPVQQTDERTERRETGRERELETQERWREQDALDKYFDQMQQWLDDESRPLLETRPAEQRRS